MVVICLSLPVEEDSLQGGEIRPQGALSRKAPPTGMELKPADEGYAQRSCVIKDLL